MSTSAEPHPFGDGGARALVRERPGARRAPQGVTPPALHDHGEVIAAALVRVAAPAGRPGAGGRGGARLGVMLQTVSVVSWLSAGRAKGAA